MSEDRAHRIHGEQLPGLEAAFHNRKMKTDFPILLQLIVIATPTWLNRIYAVDQQIFHQGFQQ